MGNSCEVARTEKKATENSGLENTPGSDLLSHGARGRGERATRVEPRFKRGQPTQRVGNPACDQARTKKKAAVCTAAFGSEIIPAVTYSPTQLPAQYHRR